MARCGPGWCQDTELCEWSLECRSPRLRCLTIRDSRHRNFGSPFCVASGTPFLSPLVLAGVAVHLTPVATTAQRARGQGFWGVVQPEYAGEAGARVLTDVFLRDLASDTVKAAEGLRWSQMASLSSEERNWP